MTEMTIDEFIAEVNKRGTIAISEIPTTGSAKDRWVCMDGHVTYLVSEPNITVTIFFEESTAGIKWVFFNIGAVDVDSISGGYALETINKLPFGVEPPVTKAVTFKSVPEGAKVTVSR